MASREYFVRVMGARDLSPVTRTLAAMKMDAVLRPAVKARGCQSGVSGLRLRRTADSKP